MQTFYLAPLKLLAIHNALRKPSQFWIRTIDSDVDDVQAWRCYMLIKKWAR